MITNYGGVFQYRMGELYDVLGLAPAVYKRWVNSNLLSMFTENEDFQSLNMMLSDSQRGRFRQDYALKRRTAEELALLSKTARGKQVRNWLLNLKDAVDNYDYLSLEQVYYLIDLVNALSFVNNQKAAEKAHMHDFVSRRGGVSIEMLCQQFHVERNKALNITPEQIRERILRYYDEEDKLVTKQRKRDILAIIDKYSLVEHGAYDFMSSIGKPSAVALKVGEIVKSMASKMNVEIRPTNEPDLFNEKPANLNPKIMRKINPHLPKVRLK